MTDTHRDTALEERRPTYCEIDLTAFEKNYQIVRRLAGEARVMAIVKADAYVHGLLEISRELERLGIDCIGVGFLEEGIVLREAGIESPILVLGGVAGYQISRFLEYKFELTASSHYITAEIDRRARRMNMVAPVHLKIDTGMNRIGVNYRRADDFLAFAEGMSNIEVRGIYSHLATAENDLEFTKLQYHRFREVINSAKRIFNPAPVFHLLNSAGLLNLPQAKLDMIRPGIILYGFVSDPSLTGKIDIEPVLSLKSEVVFLKNVAPGEGVSYGLTYKPTEETQIATIPIGYGDGYPSRLSNCGHALIGGVCYPIVGKVCMDQIMVDVGHDRVRIGQEVVLIGRQGGERVTVEEICRLTGAIPYEVTIGINSRVPRIYHKNDE